MIVPIELSDFAITCPWPAANIQRCCDPVVRRVIISYNHLDASGNQKIMVRKNLLYIFKS